MQVVSTRPRIWLSPTIISTLKARAAKPTSRMSNLLSLCNRAGEPSWDIGIMNHALAYVVTDDPKYAANAYALMSQSMSAGLKQITGDSGYQARNYLPAAAVVFDWCGKALPLPQVTALMKDMEACADWVWPETNPARAGAWGVDDPGNNYYHGFMGTWMIGLALSGFSAKAPGYIAVARNRWQNEVVPYLHFEAAGGYLQEGTNYGTSSLCSMLYYLLAHSTASDESLVNEPWLSDALTAKINLTTPDRARSYPGGDQPQNSGAPLTDYDRRAVLVLAQGYTGNARFWLDSTIPNISQQRANAWQEALWYPEETPAIDWTTTRSKTYFAPGAQLFSTRTGWGTADTQLLFQAGADMESHGDDATGAFLLFRSDWLCAQAKLASHSGLAQDAIDHNCVTFGGANQVNTENASRIIVQEDTPIYSFLQADLAPSYPGQVTAYTRSLFFLKGATSQYLLVNDQWAGNTLPATFHLQTLVQPAVNPPGFIAVSPGAVLFGRSLGSGAWTKTSVMKGSDPTIPTSWRVDFTNGGVQQFLVALEAIPAASVLLSLMSPISTPGLQGITLGANFTAWLSGPGPWTYIVPAAGQQYLLGLKPSTPYTVGALGSVWTTAAGVLTWMSSPGPVTITEGRPSPPPPPPPTDRKFLVTVPPTGSPTVVEMP